MMKLLIDTINNDRGSFFIIKDVANELINNKRLSISLERLKADIIPGEIKIPFEKKTEIVILQEIQNLLSKFNYSSGISQSITKSVENYDRESRLFDEFSLKAYSIRNKEFNKYPELINDYKEFEEALQKYFKRTLYPMQKLSAFHLAFAQNACNFAVPGAGKTSIVYAAYTYLKNLPIDNERHVDKLLVIGPLSSFAPWENEYAECFGKKINSKRLSGNMEITRSHRLEHLYSGNPCEVTLIFHGGVDSLQNDIMEFLKKNKTMVVVDEAHRIKNPNGVWGQSITEISKEAIARVILTGTPVPNGYQDLYNLYKFIYPYKYKDILKMHYKNLQEMSNLVSIDSMRVQTLKNNISPFFIRIKKSDLNLPEIEEKVIKVEMDDIQREIYDYIESKYVKSFKQNEKATVKDVLNKAKLIRLRQASTNPALLVKPLKDALANSINGDEYDPNSIYTTIDDEPIDDSSFFSKIFNYGSHTVPKKYTEIKSILEKEILANNEKVIIWSIFIQNAKDIQTFLKNNRIESKLLIGEVLQVEREDIISRFNNPLNNDFQVVIANPFAVSESISLHRGCHNAIYLERDYNCSSFLQSKDRIHRVGLNAGQITRYYYVISQDSIDEIINDRLKMKIERMEKIINDDIPLFSIINDNDETDIIKEIMRKYANRY